MYFQRLATKLLLLGFLFVGTLTAAKPLIGVVIAMQSEAQYICKQHFDGCRKFVAKDDFHFYQGHFAKHPAVLVISSVGVVNSAIATKSLIDTYHPAVVVTLGSSGGINLRQKGDVVIGSKVFNLEFGTFNPKTDQPTYPKSNLSDLYDPNDQKNIPLILGTKTNPHLQSLANKTAAYFQKHPLPSAKSGNPRPIVKVGIIANSSVFYTPNNMTEEIKKAGVDVIAFEDIGFLRTCWLMKKTCITFRSVSNALPANKGNPPASASYAGQNAALVAQRYLEFFFKSKSGINTQRQ